MNRKISQLGENELIRILLDKRDSLLDDDMDSLLFESYHDDAALIENDSKYTVLSSDMLIEHSHFPSEMSYFQMGCKIVTVNVSDIISCNATCTSILISMALPPELTLGQYMQLTDGILYKCREYNVRLIGGDINENSEVILSGTAIGVIDNNVKLQNNIQEGNLIAVTGNLGSPAAGLDLLNNDNMDIPDKEKKSIINSILEPNLPMDISQTLKKYPEMITGMTDITDGLAVELGHLSDKNKNIGFEIYFDKLPYNSYLNVIAEDNNKDILDYLLHFGEEFELLLTLDEDLYEKYESEFEKLFIIGRTTNTDNIILIKDNDKEFIKVKGYEHLKG